MNIYFKLCRLVAPLFILLALTNSAPATAGTYTWVDPDGTRHYSDKPPNNVQAKPVDLYANPVSFVGMDDGDAVQGDDESPDEKNELPKDNAAEEKNPAIMNPAEQQKYCEQARINKAALGQAGVVRQMQENGELVVIDYEQKQAQIKVADEIIAAYCQEQ